MFIAHVICAAIKMSLFVLPAPSASDNMIYIRMALSLLNILIYLSAFLWLLFNEMTADNMFFPGEPKVKTCFG